MVIKSLSLINFRNYKHFETNFNSGLNFIYGKNGQGKTNLIESLYFSTHLKSFRTPKIDQLKQFQSESASIRIQVEKQSVINNIGILLIQDKKKVSINNKILGLSSDFIRNFFSILFAPDLLSSFKEYPIERRTFFDRILYVTNAGYFQLIKEYNRIRKQKAILLKSQSMNELDIWNRLLSELIPKIIAARKKLVDQINVKLPLIFSELTGRSENLQLCYFNDFHDKIDPAPEVIFQFLTSKKEIECAKGFLYYGPHKDNYWMIRNGIQDKISFSQGEYRISFLALQLSINQIIKEELNYYPVLLLDDIFSELDESVCEKSIHHIFENHNQVFLTSTSIPDQFIGLGNLYQIESGKIIN
jgi:DNA replication and repair protein RecF